MQVKFNFTLKNDIENLSNKYSYNSNIKRIVFKRKWIERCHYFVEFLPCKITRPPKLAKW